MSRLALLSPVVAGALAVERVPRAEAEHASERDVACRRHGAPEAPVLEASRKESALSDEARRRRRRARRDLGGAAWHRLRGKLATRDPSELAPLEESSYEEVLRRRYGCFGWRQERPLRLADGRVVTTYHLARDIMLPPGSPIHSPVAAEVVRASILRAYAVVELIDRRGRLWRLMHLDRHQLRVSAGEWIASGSLIGYTSFERLPRSSSHLHLELWTSPGVRQRALQRQRRGVARLGRSARIERAALDPFAALGARGLNLLLGMRPLRSVPGACRAALGQEDDDPGAPGAPRSANRG